VGLACGDALGAPAEFKQQAEVRSRWGELRDMVGGGVWAPGEWTDDTGMALCVAQSILAAPNDPVAEIGSRFLICRQTAKDVGTTISAALAAYQGDWAVAARSTPQARAGKAAGNGSLMRTLPVAVAYADEETMLRTSARVAAMTHWDPHAEVCCAVYRLWVRALLAGVQRRAAWKAALKRGREIAGGGPLSTDTPGPAPLSSGFWERLTGVEALQYAQLQPSGYAGYVVDCLEAAATGQQALVSAVNLAGEADTIAAVTGGAAWGVASLPSRWLTALHQSEELERTAGELRYADQG
jgi:ADP-ribosyl-[dinitrogen reductase] hydrolase